jgi:hypothetical protein
MNIYSKQLLGYKFLTNYNGYLLETEVTLVKIFDITYKYVFFYIYNNVKNM